MFRKYFFLLGVVNFVACGGGASESDRDFRSREGARKDIVYVFSTSEAEFQQAIESAPLESLPTAGIVKYTYDELGRLAGSVRGASLPLTFGSEYRESFQYENSSAPWQITQSNLQVWSRLVLNQPPALINDDHFMWRWDGSKLNSQQKTVRSFSAEGQLLDEQQSEIIYQCNDLGYVTSSTYPSDVLEVDVVEIYSRLDGQQLDSFSRINSGFSDQGQSFRYEEGALAGFAIVKTINNQVETSVSEITFTELDGRLASLQTITTTSEDIDPSSPMSSEPRENIVVTFYEAALCHESLWRETFYKLPTEFSCVELESWSD